MHKSFLFVLMLSMLLPSTLLIARSTITVNVHHGSGTVSISGGGVTHSSSTSAVLTLHDSPYTFSISATGASGYTFYKWTNYYSGTENPHSFTTTGGSHSVDAWFYPTSVINGCNAASSDPTLVSKCISEYDSIGSGSGGGAAGSAGEFSPEGSWSLSGSLTGPWVVYDLYIPTGATVNTNGYPIIVMNSLTIDYGGKITNTGVASGGSECTGKIDDCYSTSAGSSGTVDPTTSYVGHGGMGSQSTGMWSGDVNGGHNNYATSGAGGSGSGQAEGGWAAKYDWVSDGYYFTQASSKSYGAQGSEGGAYAGGGGGSSDGGSNAYGKAGLGYDTHWIYVIGGAGGKGGGIVQIYANTLINNGEIDASGSSGIVNNDWGPGSALNLHYYIDGTPTKVVCIGTETDSNCYQGHFINGIHLQDDSGNWAYEYGHVFPGGGGGGGYIYLYVRGSVYDDKIGQVTAAGGDAGSLSAAMASGTGYSIQCAGGGGGGYIVIDAYQAVTAAASQVSVSGGHGTEYYNTCAAVQMDGGGDHTTIKSAINYDGNAGTKTVYSRPNPPYAVTFSSNLDGVLTGAAASNTDFLTVTVTSGGSSNTYHYSESQLPKTINIPYDGTATYSYASVMRESYNLIYNFYQIVLHGNAQNVGRSGTIAGPASIESYYNSETEPCSPGANGLIYCTYPSSDLSGTTTYSPQGCGLTSSTSSAYTTSPISTASAYNDQNAVWLLSAPSTPVSFSDGNPTNFYFTTSGTTTIGGNRCLSQMSSLTTNVVYTFTAAYNGITLADASLTDLHLANAANIIAKPLAFSPEVDGAISNNYNSKSYIFQDVPSVAQKALWTWQANFVDMNQLASLQETQQHTLPQLSYSTGSCTYTYDYELTSSVDNFQPSLIPFNVVTGNNQYSTIQSKIYPYLLYNASMQTPGGVWPLHLSYQLFSPWTYNSPQTKIDSLPVDTPAKFYGTYNGFLFSTPTSSDGVSPASSVINGVANMLDGLFANGKLGLGIGSKSKLQSNGAEATAVSNVIDMISSPDGYMYVLNQSQHSGQYYLNILQVFPQGYYTAPSLSPSSQIKPTSDSSSWFNEWNAYWANTINDQNSETHLVKTIILNSPAVTSSIAKQDPSFDGNFLPLALAGDYQGDIFITASYNKGNAKPVVIEVTNTVGNGPIELIPQVITTPALGVALDGRAQVPADSLMPEIAVSPTGGQFYLANQSAGYILVYSIADGQFSYSSNVDLTFRTLLPGSSQTQGVLNITQYLKDGGLYGVKDLDNFIQQGADYELDSNFYHHPVGIADVNGYLYVLDNWAGTADAYYECTDPNISPCPPNRKIYRGEFFDILMLRAINSTGASVPIGGTNVPDIWDSTASSPVPNTYASTYPPYGWVLSANVTGAQVAQRYASDAYMLNNNGNHPVSTTFCSSPKCTYTPSSLSDSYIFKPIGPELYALWPLQDGGAFKRYVPLQDAFAPLIRNVSFNINFENVATIMFNSYNYVENLYVRGTYAEFDYHDHLKTYNANQYNELITTKFQLENYTKIFGGNPPYDCYVASTSSAASGTTCSHSIADFNNIRGLAAVPSAFRFLEGTGSPQFLTLEGYYGSSGFGSGSGTGGGSQDQCAQNLTQTGTCSNVNVSTSISTSLQDLNNAPSTQPFTNQEAITSSIGGYLLVPYSYHYTIHQTYTTTSKSPSSCSSLNSPSDISETVYTDQLVNVPSNYLLTPVEGGSTYVQYLSGAYYIPNLTSYGAVLPPQLLFNLETNRFITSAYVNITSLQSSGTNYGVPFSGNSVVQYALNATKQFTYQLTTYAQGSYPGYQVINTIVGTQAYAPAAYDGPAAKLLNYNSNMTYDVAPISGVISVFDWTKGFVYSDPLYLLLRNGFYNYIGYPQSPAFIQQLG